MACVKAAGCQVFAGDVSTRAVEKFYSRMREFYLFPVASLPLGTSAASAAPLLAGFGGQVLAVLLPDGAA